MESNTTVVISNYNYGAYVPSAIDSCLAQSVPCKIIVVDDASTDQSWRKIKRYASDQVTCVRLKKNSRGNARGKNVGIALSDTEYITCLDSDDMLLPKSIEKRRNLINGKDFVHGWAYALKTRRPYDEVLVKLSGLSLREQEKAYEAKYRRKTSKLSAVKWAFKVKASTVLARRSLYEKFGLYDEHLRWKIDKEMWHRWLYHGATQTWVAEYISVYRKHRAQVTRNRKVKDPNLIRRLFAEAQQARKKISNKNTLMLDEYDANKHIRGMT